MIIKFKDQKPFGIVTGSMKENKRKLGETDKKSGYNSNQARIVEVGVKLVELVHDLTIGVALGL